MTLTLVPPLEFYDDFSETNWSCMLYGESGVGKTTLAAHDPSAVIVNIENGLKGVDLRGLGAVATAHLDDYETVYTAMQQVANDDRFQTVVVDLIQLAPAIENKGEKH